MAYVEIFRAGKYPQGTFTTSDLKKIADSYDYEKVHKAPLVVGHPRTDSPAYGWVKHLRVSGPVLEAEFRDVEPTVRDWHETGRYRTRSAAFYMTDTGSWYLRHVGLLGAEPPQVKGLKEAQFASTDRYIEIEFSEVPPMKMFQRIREWIVSRFGMAEAEQVLPAAELEAMQAEKEAEKTQEAFKAGMECGAEQAPAAMEPAMEMSENKVQEDDMKEIEELKAQVEALKKENAEFAETKRQMEVKLATQTIQERVTALGDRITPGEKPGMVEYLSSLSDVVEVTFSEAEKVSQREWMFRHLASRTLPNFAEVATQSKAAESAPAPSPEFANADPERLAMFNEAKAIAKERKVTFAEALTMISKK